MCKYSKCAGIISRNLTMPFYLHGTVSYKVNFGVDTGPCFRQGNVEIGHFCV